MSSSLNISAFRQITDDLAAIEQTLVLTQNLLDEALHQEASSVNMQTRLNEVRNKLNLPAQSLRERIKQISLIYNTYLQFSSPVTANEVANIILDAIWQRASLSFAVMVLGESELGPYRYQSLRGIPDAYRYVGKECPFPLWGILARALVRRPGLDEADYVVVDDLRNTVSPKVEEFPWMPRTGSLLVLPLRQEEVAAGALILGQNQPGGFQSPQLCADFYDLADLAARSLYHTQLRQELTERDGQLVGLQLFTKSLTGVSSFGEILERVATGISELVGDVSAHFAVQSDALQSSQPESSTTSQYKGRPVGNGTLTAFTLSEDSHLHEVHPQLNELMEWTFQSGQPIFYDPDNTIVNPRDLYYNQSGRGVVVPIYIADQVSGSLHVSAPNRAKPFEESDMVVLRTVANVVAVTLAESLIKVKTDKKPSNKQNLLIRAQ